MTTSRDRTDSLTTSSTKEAERNLLKCLLLHVDIAAIIFGYIKKSFLISQRTKKKKKEDV